MSIRRDFIQIYFSGATDTYGFNSRNISTVPISNINKNHVSGGRLPVDHPNRYDSRYQQHQGRNTHRYKIRQHKHQSHCRKYVRVGRSRMKPFGKVFSFRVRTLSSKRLWGDMNAFNTA